MFDRWDGRGTPLRAEALAVGSTAMLLSGDLDGADRCAREALDDPEATTLARMMAERSRGYVCAHRGDREAGLAHLDAAIAAAADHAPFRRELEVSWAAIVEDPAVERRALSVVERVAAEAAAEGEAVNQAWAHVVAVSHRLRLGEVSEAGHDADAVLRLADRGAVAYLGAAGHRAKAMALAAGGDWAGSVPHWLASLRLTTSTGDVEGLVLTMHLAASAAATCGLDGLARELWSASPPGDGHTVLPSPFAEAHAALEATPRRHATAGADEAVRRASALLSTPAGRAAAVQPATAPPEAAAPVAPAAPSSPAEPAPAATRPERGRIVRFETCELDLGRHELRRDGEVVKVEPQVFDVLVMLTDHHGLLVTKNELLDQVWGDRFVSESALTSRIRAARAAVGDDGRQQRVIRTVHARGYMFVAEVTVA